MLINIIISAALIFAGEASAVTLAIWLLIAVSVLVSSTISRAMFYVMVVPTTMPGAFFWKNKGFEEHARETGLANVVQAGIIADTH